jgi:hypothetical protein
VSRKIKRYTNEAARTIPVCQNNVKSVNRT